MEVKLRKKTKDYLLSALRNEDEDIFLQLMLSKKNTLGSKNDLYVKEGLVEVIRDWAMDKQQIIGFDEDYDLTNEGEMLQEIIDKFYS